LDAWLGLAWGPWWTLAASYRCGVKAACYRQYSAWSMRHRGWAVGGCSSNLASILSWCVRGSLLLLNECLLVWITTRINSGRLLSSLVCLFCHWLVGRVGRRGLLNVVPLARALKGLFASETEVEGPRECFAAMVSGGWFENLGAETEVRERESRSDG